MESLELLQRRSGRTFIKWDTSQGWPWHYSDQLYEMLTPPGQDFSGASTHCVSDLKRRITGRSFPEHRERSLDEGCWVMYPGARPATSPLQSSAPTPTATEAFTQFRAWEYKHEAVFCTVFHSRHSVLMVLLVVCGLRVTESLSPPYRLFHTSLLYRPCPSLSVFMRPLAHASCPRPSIALYA